MGERELQIELRGAYRAQHLDRLIRQLDPMRSLTEPTRVRIDLSGLAWIAAAPLALLVATVRDVASRGLIAQPSPYIAPRNYLIARYVARMDFERLLVHPVPKEDFERRPERAFRPCQAFSDEADLDWVADSLTGALVEACHPDAHAKDAIWFCLNELAQNAVQHARSPAGAIGVAGHVKTRKMIEIAIADCGVGVLHSLRSNPAYEDLPDDLAALRAALQPGVSARSTKGGSGGVGLFLTQELLKHNGGSLLVRSGDASLSTGAAEVATSGQPVLRGTVAALQARIDKPLELDWIFGVLPSGTGFPPSPEGRRHAGPVALASREPEETPAARR